MNEFFTWAFLATYAGAAVATGILTQFFKEIFKSVPTQILSYVFALVILAFSTAATGGASDWAGWALIPLNAILVSLASNGGYTVVERMTGSKKEG